MTHTEFVAAFSEGRVSVRVDPQRAPGFVSARLLLPFVLLPLLGAAVALALLGFVLIGMALGAAALLLRHFVRRSSAGFVLSRSLAQPGFYRDALHAGVLQLEPAEKKS
jgi:predicted membrane-bound spermidine synthase